MRDQEAAGKLPGKAKEQHAARVPARLPCHGDRDRAKSCYSCYSCWWSWWHCLALMLS